MLHVFSYSLRRPPSRRVELLRRQVHDSSKQDGAVTTLSRSAQRDIAIAEEEEQNSAVGDDFTFESFFAGNFESVPSCSEAAVVRGRSSSSEGRRTNVPDVCSAASPSTVTAALTNFHFPLKEEVEEFPPPPSRSVDLWSSSSSSSSSRVSTPPPLSHQVMALATAHLSPPPAPPLQSQVSTVNVGGLSVPLAATPQHLITAEVDDGLSSSMNVSDILNSVLQGDRPPADDIAVLLRSASQVFSTPMELPSSVPFAAVSPSCAPLCFSLPAVRALDPAFSMVSDEIEGLLQVPQRPDLSPVEENVTQAAAATTPDSLLEEVRDMAERAAWFPDDSEAEDSNERESSSAMPDESESSSAMPDDAEQAALFPVSMMGAAAATAVYVKRPSRYSSCTTSTDASTSDLSQASTGEVETVWQKRRGQLAPRLTLDASSSSGEDEPWEQAPCTTIQL